MIIDQASHLIGIETPLGENELLLSRMTASEELGRLFLYDLALLSENNSIDLDAIVGQNVTMWLELPSGKRRHFNGVVSEFAQVGQQRRLTQYHALVRPWFWLLTRTSDCRIFQAKTVPRIVKEVLNENGYSDIDDRLVSNYREWDYCVQYRETDCNFLSRLMEQAGIYFFFEHEDGKHTLVLADSSSAHGPVTDYEELPFFAADDDAPRERDHLSEFRLSRRIQPGKYSLNDFDFTVPGKSLRKTASDPRDHAQAEFEVYDYPGEYTQSEDGENYVKLRLEELQIQNEVVTVSGNARGLQPGSTFKLSNHPRNDQNREYMVIRSVTTLVNNAFQSGESGSGGGLDCTASHDLIPVSTSYRAPRQTPKPLVQGPQTAVVVGPAGEEIFTDDYGRVKLQFHWDRYGASDEQSSCWVRVSQSWAGKKWGGITIPRIGQEVIVEFLEGDPDQPIVTGRVYNGDNMPPYELPANKTQSGLKSRSSKSGSEQTFNEIRFEDKKGSEEMYLHAEKNQTTVVENNQAINVGNDKTESIGHDNTEDVGNDETITVGNNRAKTVGVNQEETIGANKTVKVGANHSESIGTNMTITVAANLTESVAVNYAETVGAAMELTVGGLFAQTVGAAKTTSVGANESLEVGANRSINVGKDNSTKVGKNFTIDAGDQIQLVTGEASITMKKDGTIVIKGKDISLQGDGKISVKAKKNVIIKGKKILEN